MPQTRTARPVGVTKQTPNRLLLDAGAIYKNLTYDETKKEWTGVALGATSGGNEFSTEMETRQPEIDGIKSAIKGMEFVNEHNAQLVVNLKELTVNNLKDAIAAADIEENAIEGYDKIVPRANIQLEDYLENIAYVGRLSNNKKPVIIILKNALSVEGLELSTEDNDEAVIPITFNAFNDFDDAMTEKAPYEIYWPKEEENNGNDGNGSNNEGGGTEPDPED